MHRQKLNLSRGQRMLSLSLGRSNSYLSVENVSRHTENAKDSAPKSPVAVQNWMKDIPIGNILTLISLIV